MSILQLQDVTKIYKTRFDAHQVTALEGMTFSMEEGEYIAVMGESGSGKTTLLNILASLDTPSSGTVLLDGKNIADIPENQLARFRRESLGFVFQEFNLLDTFSVRDNILLPLVLSRFEYREMESRLAPLAQKLGITTLLDKFPYEVSGGEKQRTAVARALITEPRLVLADEPTGALDSHSASSLLDIFSDIHQSGQSVFMVTHSLQAASHASRVLFIRDGSLYSQLYRGSKSYSDFYQQISHTLTVIATGREHRD